MSDHLTNWSLGSLERICPWLCPRLLLSTCPIVYIFSDCKLLDDLHSHLITKENSKELIQHPLIEENNTPRHTYS
uniref:Putative ovule protein n=1 Tax=Solanum chacoense TaxID=4108 RepID=A0A0V0GJJ7_SOLCH